MKSGEAIRYFDEHGTNVHALLVKLHDGDQGPADVVVIKDGRPVLIENVPHRSGRIETKERTVVIKPERSGRPEITEQKVVSRRLPGDFWLHL